MGTVRIIFLYNKGRFPPNFSFQLLRNLREKGNFVKLGMALKTALLGFLSVDNISLEDFEPFPVGN